jgi:archaemetzincin
MKLTAGIFLLATTSLLLTGCTKGRENFFQPGNQSKIIALQPLDDYNPKQIDFIRKEIESFYNVKVIVLQSVNLPESFRLESEAKIYSADSILDMLSAKLDNQIIEVVALTHKSIYVLKNKTNNSILGKGVQPVFGLADFTGNCAVITDVLFNSIDTIVFQHRLRTTVIHEIGHNIGLDHCASERCIMSEQNGKLSALDKSERDYCNQCRKKLKKINPAYPWLKSTQY